MLVWNNHHLYNEETKNTAGVVYKNVSQKYDCIRYINTKPGSALLPKEYQLQSQYKTQMILPPINQHIKLRTGFISDPVQPNPPIMRRKGKSTKSCYYFGLKPSEISPSNPHYKLTSKLQLDLCNQRKLAFTHFYSFFRSPFSATA